MIWLKGDYSGLLPLLQPKIHRVIGSATLPALFIQPFRQNIFFFIQRQFTVLDQLLEYFSLFYWHGLDHQVDRIDLIAAFLFLVYSTGFVKLPQLCVLVVLVDKADGFSNVLRVSVITL